MLYLKPAAALVALIVSFCAGVRWQQGADAIELQKAQDSLKQLSAEADEKGIEHAESLDKINTQLLNTQKALAQRTDGRRCLSAAAVRVLDSPAAPVPVAASEPASAPEAFATDRDVGEAIAVCRAGYEGLADQLNKILDIEDARQNMR